MWLITVIMDDGRKARRVMKTLQSARDFCAYAEHMGLKIWECQIVGTDITRAFCT